MTKPKVKGGLGSVWVGLGSVWGWSGIGLGSVWDVLRRFCGCSGEILGRFWAGFGGHVGAPLGENGEKKKCFSGGWPRPGTVTGPAFPEFQHRARNGSDEREVFRLPEFFYVARRDLSGALYVARNLPRLA